MNRQEAFAKLQSLSDAFVAQLAHPEGGRVTRALLRNVDADIITNELIIFKNKDGKFVVFVFGLSATLPRTPGQTEQMVKLPNASEVRASHISKILPFLVKRDASISETDQMDVIEQIPDWINASPFSSQNLEKIKMFNELKDELKSLGMIQ